MDGEETKKKNSSEKETKKRKRNAYDAYDEERSDTVSDAGEPVDHKEPRLLEKNDGRWDEEMGGDASNPNAVSKFRISKVLREKLKSRGIESLFPIQAKTFDIILDGSDLVGRARTG